MSNRLPKRLWRVEATGGRRQYWEPASRTYTREDYARSKADQYRQQGATEVHIYYADPAWVEVAS